MWVAFTSEFSRSQSAYSYRLPDAVNPPVVPACALGAEAGWAVSLWRGGPATCNHTGQVEWVSLGVFKQLHMPGKP